VDIGDYILGRQIYSREYKIYEIIGIEEGMFGRPKYQLEVVFFYDTQDKMLVKELNQRIGGRYRVDVDQEEVDDGGFVIKHNEKNKRKHLRLLFEYKMER